MPVFHRENRHRFLFPRRRRIRGKPPVAHDEYRPQTLRSRARQIAAAGPPLAFYRDFERPGARSSETPLPSIRPSQDPRRCEKQARNDFGHGLPHVTKVSIDAGALIQVEGGHAGLAPDTIDRLLCNVQTAGLLHDILRKEENHATRGADYVIGFLADHTLRESDIADISTAIYNHEAFRPQRPCPRWNAAWFRTAFTTPTSSAGDLTISPTPSGKCSPSPASAGKSWSSSFPRD
jgi:hypothetical protein